MTKLQERLDMQNGNRQCRLLSLEDIVEAAEEAKPGSPVFLHGGHVANSYRYPAEATAAVVYRHKRDRMARVQIIVANAKKGSTGFGRRSSWTPPEKGIPGEVRVNAEDILRATASSNDILVEADRLDECGNETKANLYREMVTA